MNFAAKIKAKREALGYSQEFMARQLGITQASYSRMETDKTKPSPNALLIMAKVFNISVLYFFDEN